MHPLIARATGTALGRRRARRRVRARRRSRRSPRSREHRARRRVPLLAQQPDRHRARRSTVIEAVLRRRARAWSWSTRRTPSSPDRRASASTLLPGRPRLVVTRTMSKAFAFAAARLGYLAADPAVVDALQLVRLPYHLSALTQAAARARWPTPTSCSPRVERDPAQRDRHRRASCAALGLDGGRRDANFVLFGGFGDRHAVWQGLLDRGRAGPRRRPARLAAGHRRHPGRDGRLPRARCRGRTASCAADRAASRSEQAARSSATTKESEVLVELDLDGTGRADVETGVPFFDHMLAQLGKHGGFDLTVRTKGDLEVDAHHTVEDTAIALGQALREALGDKAGIRRFGDALVPLDETLVAGRGRPVRPAVPRARGAGDRRADRQLRHHADPAHLGVVRCAARRSACTCGCSPAATPTTSSRRSSRPSRGRCATPSRSTRGSPASRPPRAR